MDANLCLVGIDWFASCRETPNMIWSENGTKFFGTEVELRENIENWNTNNIAAELAHKGFGWKFKPPPVRPIKVASWRG